MQPRWVRDAGRVQHADQARKALLRPVMRRGSQKKQRIGAAGQELRKLRPL